MGEPPEASRPALIEILTGFGNILSRQALAANHAQPIPANPKGIASSSPGLFPEKAQRREQPWVLVAILRQPQRGCGKPSGSFWPLSHSPSSLQSQTYLSSHSISCLRNNALNSS